MKAAFLFFSAALAVAACAQTPATPAFVGAPEPGKAAKPSPLTPEEQRAAFTLPPGFEIELVAAEAPGIGKFITVDWDQQGRMWSMTAFEYPVDANEDPEAAKALYNNPGKDRVLVWDTPFAPGPQTPRVFADGLAIPLGVLPYKSGVYVQHGPEIVFLDDTDGDGRAGDRKVILSGFGVQDSHLFPHQFTRAPGGWIWMAQGAFNSGRVKTPEGPEVQFNGTRMARFRPDGTGFDITSQGPCNIWGLVINGEGEAFIQEANDYGYPVMPFHEYANYPGCADALFKSYAPHFPGTADFRLGGTGLSGLALSDASGAWPQPYADVMYVANPITRRINSIKMHRDGPHWRLERLPDLVASRDEWFRPIAIHFGPDGCLYIVDWYNQIISHNEVPRQHPERDKTRGRIWRVKGPGQKPFAVPDFTKLSTDELIAKLGGDSLRQSHLAWQTLADRGNADEAPVVKLEAVIRDASQSAARRIQALWALQGVDGDDIWILRFPELAKDPNRNVRRELVRMDRDNGYSTWEMAGELQPLLDDPDPEVRAEVIRAIGSRIADAGQSDESLLAGVNRLVHMAKAPLAGPLAPSTRDGRPMKVRDAYDRDFERYLVRQTLERAPRVVAMALDSSAADALPLENRLLAALALEPRESARRVAKLLADPDQARAPNQEEMLRLAQFPQEPGVQEALSTLLSNAGLMTGAVEALLGVRTRIDAGKLKPLLVAPAKTLLGGKDRASAELGLRLVGAFGIEELEPDVASLAAPAPRPNGEVQGASALQLPAVKALREIGSGRAELFAALAKNRDEPALREEALAALASSRHELAGALLLEMWPQLQPSERRTAMDGLSSTKAGAQAVVAAVKSGALSREDLGGATAEKLQTILGGDPELAALLTDLADLLRPVLVLDGKDHAFTEAGITLDGPFTVETWVRLEPGISNQDGILGAPGVLDMNFYDSTFRVWVGGIGDAVIARKPVSAGVWTHLAVTRNAAGMMQIYIDGILESDAAKPAPAKFENLRIGWTGTKGGTAGALSEFRVWNRARSGDEIAATIDRSFKGAEKPGSLVFLASRAGSWGVVQPGAKLVKTTDHPPLLTAEQAAELDAKFARYRHLAEQPGDLQRGKVAAASCLACHLIQGEGGNLGPNLSGIGAMGTEGILRNLLTPNAAMEAGYRIFRVELQSGDLVDAFFVSEDKDALVVRLPGGEDRRIPKREVRHSGYLRRSLMPEGLLDTMRPQQVSDLFTYLRSLR